MREDTKPDYIPKTKRFFFGDFKWEGYKHYPLSYQIRKERIELKLSCDNP
jgi:hypothetical protein